ncbi:hypothetical protein NUW58_g9920 [Xylaria curta]|uniref:Uncharacterized protein n=1 Tax=Xylaria curta TaxID=42375 RepID=A0ACC1MTL9_9PEZI|nr:hypothetical protein NUW58_g9920 [Xylaria curta]
MFKLADLAEQEKEVLATIETWDNGKPYGDALGDLGEVIDCIRYYAGWADKIYGQTIPTTAQKFAYTLKQPIGVCGQIIPARGVARLPYLEANDSIGGIVELSPCNGRVEIGTALACGNTVVLKPAEQTPLSILYFANLIVKAGFPPGVVNITFSHNIVANHHKSLLWGGGEKEGPRDIGKMRFTVFANHFANSSSRNPLMRFGTFYIANNVFSNYANKPPLYPTSGAATGSPSGSDVRGTDTMENGDEVSYMPNFQYNLGVYNLSSVLVSGNYFDQTGCTPRTPHGFSRSRTSRRQGSQAFSAAGCLVTYRNERYMPYAATAVALRHFAPSPGSPVPLRPAWDQSGASLGGKQARSGPSGSPAACSIRVPGLGTALGLTALSSSLSFKYQGHPSPCNLLCREDF